MRTVGLALRHRDLRLLLAAGLISQTGDWVLSVGLAYYVYALTGSTLASAIALLASFVPQIALGSLAGVFVDRWDLKRTMVAADVLLALGLLPLLAVHRPGQIWIVYLVSAWQGVVQQFFAPAQQALIPRVVEEAHLVTANALGGQSNDVARLIGAALGGVVVAVGGIRLLALVDAASFLISAGLLARMRAAPDPHQSAVHEASGTLRARVSQVRAEWADGLRLCLGHKVLRVIGLFMMVSCVGEGIMGTLFAPFVRTVLHASSGTYGVIGSVQAIGGICGGLLAAAYGHRLPVARVMGLSALAFGAIDLALFLYPLAYVAAWPAIVLMIVVGVPGAFLTAAAMTLLQRGTTDTHRGRVFGALGAVEGAAIVGGALAAGLLGQSLGIIPTLAAQGGGYVLAGALVLVALRGEPYARRADEPPNADAANSREVSMDVAG
jgi:Na+/melibiose symporter-like transporter